jgi:hypothetical protein
MPHATDLNLAPKEIQGLTSADALAAFLGTLGYESALRKPLTPEAIGLSGESAAAIRAIEVLSEDAEGFLRVVFVQLRSLTAKSRNDLARVLGRTNVDHLLILTSDYSTLEFVLLDKRRRESRRPADVQRIQVVPLSIAVDRKSLGTRELRALRRLTWTGRDGLEQFDKLRTVFEAAAFSEDYFCNRALFADHYLLTRLREGPAWRDNPTEVFQQVKQFLANARQRWLGKGEQIVRDELFEPLLTLLGFEVQVNKAAGDSDTRPDYLLTVPGGKTAAYTYAWDRWLDGPDVQLDQHTPEENPGACVVTSLDKEVADWIIMTNGRQWRLYSRQAHSRATNFYEVDLAEALIASGDTDPNEAFRYWWLFFRAAAFSSLKTDAKARAGEKRCWLDTIAEGSREYAKQLGERLKQRIFETIFPHLAKGFLEDRQRRLGVKTPPGEDDLHDIYEATLTLLYRLLFLLYAESRDLLPIREAPYRAASLTKIKEQIAQRAGIAESESAARIEKAFSADETSLYDRLQRLCAALDCGDASLNVPIYTGGLFITSVVGTLVPTSAENRGVAGAKAPTTGSFGYGHESREQRIARFLLEHKIPDRYLALAIDRLARDPDDKTLALVFIDYKSLEVRHLGSIYEGLLEFKLRVAEEDLTTKTEKGKEKLIPLTAAKTKRKREPEAVVRRGDVYLSNDKAERKASGSYYTPDPIVEYIVANTVGPVLDERLESLRDEFRQVRKTFERHLKNAADPRIHSPFNQERDVRREAAEKTYDAHRALVERLFEFRTLDPAMGSGHFLVEAVDYLTDRLLTFLNQFPVNPVSFMLERTRRNILSALDEQGVQVDPDKLTEVNLLKRHVLKRCIYGVDLNPMAVELAKVSLWLDAFTIGAPLSFLDHHLRCGNSLIGATFRDLEAAVTPQVSKTERLTKTMLGIDYEPLLRAIRHVIQVNQMADATAAEVKKSASEYDAARHELSGYQIVLDLLVARHFGLPKAAGLLEHGSDLDLSSRARFLASLPDAGERGMVAKVESLARQADRRFFHWEIEFPEVFFTFADPTQRRIKHKDEIAPGAAGFDAVVGNPPYVRQEALKTLKKHFSECFESYHSVADLFAYFYDKASTVVCNGGIIGFITSGSWMKANFGGPIRSTLARRMSLRSVIDFGEWQPFPGAEMIRPSVVVLQRGGADANARVFRFLTKGNPPSDLSAAVGGAPEIDASSLGSAEWRLEDGNLTSIFEKMQSRGVALGAYTEGQVYRGVTNGLTDAFVIDGGLRGRLIDQDKSSEGIIKPYLEGKDLRSWHVEKNDRWLVFTRRGTDINRYAAIREYLATFREQLTPRKNAGDRHGRKPGSYEWFEIQDNVAYFRAFEMPKIVWPDISKLPRFCMDLGNHYLGNTGYVIPLEDYFLLGVLASWPTWFMISRICQPLRLRGGRWQYRLIRQFMERLPIPADLNETNRDRIAELARMCNELGAQGYELESAGLKRIQRELMPVDAAIPKALRNWWEPDFQDFKELIESCRQSPFVGESAAGWELRLTCERKTLSEIHSKIKAAEGELSERVADAFGLNRSEFTTIMKAVES